MAEGLTEEDGKLNRNGRLLVPESRVLQLCEAWHHRMMHPGGKKQALDMQRRSKIDRIGLCNAIEQVKKGCSVCQPCNPDNRNVWGEAQWTPIPDQPMETWRVWPGLSSPCPKYMSEKKFGLCGPASRPTQWLRCGRPGAQRGVVSQESGSHDDLSLADRLWILSTVCSARGPQFTGG